jgi:amidase
MGEWTGKTATEIAAAVRDGKVTAREVVREHLDRIAALDGEIGAFVRVRGDAALREAERLQERGGLADLPLAGVPVAIKDNIPVAGEPMRSGSAATPAERQDADHPVVARLRAAGAIIVGSTNLPELGIYPFTDSVYGVARNPWELRRTPGGSSGGAAAAVASGMVPIAHGNDGAGSIRIPAADCGLVGVKPGSGVVPAEIGVDSWGGMSENGPLATTVADAALTLAVMAGAPPAPVVEELTGLRIAASVKSPVIGVSIHPEFRAAVRQAAALLRDTHRVVHADPPIPLWLGPAITARWTAYPARDAAPYLGGGELEQRTLTHLKAGQVLSRLRPPCNQDRARLRAAVEPFFAEHDVLLMPALAQYAPRARRWGERPWVQSFLLSIRHAPMTGAWNLAGYPAASVPMGVGANGLPLAVQLVGRPGGENILLGVAAQLERLHPWTRLAPAYTG